MCRFIFYVQKPLRRKYQCNSCELDFPLPAVSSCPKMKQRFFLSLQSLVVNIEWQLMCHACLIWKAPTDMYNSVSSGLPVGGWGVLITMLTVIALTNMSLDSDRIYWWSYSPFYLALLLISFLDMLQRSHCSSMLVPAGHIIFLLLSTDSNSCNTLPSGHEFAEWRDCSEWSIWSLVCN